MIQELNKCYRGSLSGAKQKFKAGKITEKELESKKRDLDLWKELWDFKYKEYKEKLNETNY